MYKNKYVSLTVLGLAFLFTVYSLIQELSIMNTSYERNDNDHVVNNLKNRLLLQINANQVFIDPSSLTCIDKSPLEKTDTLKKGKIGLFISNEQCVNCWQKDLELLDSLHDITKADSPIIFAADFSIRELNILQENYPRYSVYSVNTKNNIELQYLKKYKLPFYFKINNLGYMTSVFFPIDNIMNIVKNDYFALYTDTLSTDISKEELNIDRKNELLIDNPIVNIGNIKMRNKKEIIFKITNKSDVACNIYEAKPTCTCISVSSFPEVINPGESNNVIVSFISNIKGKFTRKVVLRTNFSNTLYELTVTGNVI